MVRTDMTKAMVKDMYKWYYEKWDAYDLTYPKILAEEDSNAAYEQSTSAIAAGELVEVAEGVDIPAEDDTEAWTTYGKNRKFARAKHITEELVDDHQKVENLLKKAAGQWGDAVGRTLDSFFAKIFIYGGYTAGRDDIFDNSIAGIVNDPSGDLIYDSEPLFNLSDNTRSSKGGGTYYNGFALDLNPDNLEAVFEHMTAVNNRNERDEEIKLVPNTLLVPPQLTFTGRRILESVLIPGSDYNDKNVLQNIMNLETWHRLSGDSDAWFIGIAKHPQGLIAQKRREPKIDFYYDEDKEIYKAKISMRYGCRIDNWRPWCGSNFSTSA